MRVNCSAKAAVFGRAFLEADADGKGNGIFMGKAENHRREQNNFGHVKKPLVFLISLLVPARVYLRL